MAPLLINLNQLVNLSVNPSKDATINTTLLHCLLHVIVNQLNLQTCRVEFHGQGSNQIENLILEQTDNRGLDLKEFDVTNVIDDITNTTYQKRNEKECLEETDVTKIITITDACRPDHNMIGFPLQPIPVISIAEFEKLEMKVHSIHDVIGHLIPTTSDIMNNACSMNNLMDILNVTKRIEALEIADIKLAELMKQIQCGLVTPDSSVFPGKMKEVVYHTESFHEEETKSLSIQIVDYLAELDEHPLINYLEKEIDKLKKLIQGIPQCLCLDEEYKKALFEEIQEKLLAPLESKIDLLKLEIESFRNECDCMKKAQEDQTEMIKKFVCETLKTYEMDLVGSLIEIQDMLDAKVDKIDIEEMKRYLLEMVTAAISKSDEITDPLAAGATKRIMKKLNCISCGDKVGQVDRGSFKVTQTEAETVDEKLSNKLNLTSRHCGGKHTITHSSEKVLHAGNFKDFMKSVNGAKL